MIIIINKNRLSFSSTFVLVTKFQKLLKILKHRIAYRRRRIKMYHLLNRVIPQTQTLPTLQSNHLFAMTKEIRIQHEGEEYRLRLTRNNRLILTK